MQHRYTYSISILLNCLVRAAISRVGAKCLSSIYAFDNALEDLEMLESAQEKFNEILNSPSLGAACEKIKGLAKAKELDSSLILLINSTWASAKDSPTIKNEVSVCMIQFLRLLFLVSDIFKMHSHLSPMIIPG